MSSQSRTIKNQKVCSKTHFTIFKKLNIVYYATSAASLLYMQVAYIIFFTLRAQSGHLAHARIIEHALNQAFYTLYKKIVFDMRVRK